MDYEGRSDGRSIKKIITHLAPKKTVNNTFFHLFIYLFQILIHGTTEATQHLSDYLVAKKIFVATPYVGETVDVTEATNLYRVCPS